YIFEHTVCKLDEGDGNTGEDLLNVKGNLWRTFQETIVAPENAADYEKGIWMFDYSVTDSTVVATTNKNFGKEGASIFYFLPTGPWGVSDDKTSESIIDPNWLP
nr:hypothetical protein [Candidatus Cloacimonadota bacterium]